MNRKSHHAALAVVLVLLADVHLDHHEGLVELTGKGWLPVQEAVHLLTPTAPLAPHQQQYLLVLLLRPDGGSGEISRRIPLLVIALTVIGQAPGPEVVTRAGGKARIDVGAFSSEIVTQPQPDGSLAFVTIDPVAAGFQMVRADKDGKRALVVRDGQHEYVFDAVE